MICQSGVEDYQWSNLPKHREQMIVEEQDCLCHSGWHTLVMFFSIQFT